MPLDNHQRCSKPGALGAIFLVFSASQPEDIETKVLRLRLNALTSTSFISHKASSSFAFRLISCSSNLANFSSASASFALNLTASLCCSSFSCSSFGICLVVWASMVWGGGASAGGFAGSFAGFVCDVHGWKKKDTLGMSANFKPAKSQRGPQKQKNLTMRQGTCLISGLGTAHCGTHLHHDKGEQTKAQSQLYIHQARSLQERVRVDIYPD